jgi:hypothetical protein
MDKKSAWWKEAFRTVPRWSKIKPAGARMYLEWRTLCEARNADNWLVTVTTFVGNNKQVQYFPFERVVHARTCFQWWKVYGGKGCTVDFNYIDKQ